MYKLMSAIVGFGIFSLITGCTGTVITAASVVAAVENTCAVIPSIEDIANLIKVSSTTGDVITTVESWANLICGDIAAVTPKSGTPSGVEKTVIIDGVVVHYKIK